MMFPNFAALASIALVIPVSTAECFSCMKRIKTALRNRMETETLDQLMPIASEGPKPEDFNFDRAADLWGAIRQRRISV